MKPRLYCRQGLWRCWTLIQKDERHFTYRSGLGWTKRDAYEDWLLNSRLQPLAAMARASDDIGEAL